MRFIGLVLICTGVFALCVLSYRLGVSNAKVKIVEKQVEVLKVVEKAKEKKQIRREKIYSKPSAGKSDVVKWLRTSGKH